MTIVTILAALLLGIATSIWRWHDGRDAELRWANSSSYAAVLSLVAGALAYGPWVLDYTRLGVVAFATIFVWRMLLMGFDGWENWGYILKSRAAPTAAVGVAIGIYFQSFALAALALSGLLVAVTYVCLAKREQIQKAKLGQTVTEYRIACFTAQQWGEISHGFFTMGLALMGLG